MERRDPKIFRSFFKNIRTRPTVFIPARQDRVRDMMAEVWRWIRETGDRSLNETHYFSMRMGAVGPNSAEN